ncbi:hypothetical protein Tco_1333754, partial [Tanacetum coccineum]
SKAGEKMEDLGTMEKMEKMTGRQHLVEDERWRRWKGVI